MATTTDNLELVFGTDSSGDSPTERASSSQTIFVRSQDELAEFSPSAKGRQFTAAEALLTFGYDTLLEVAYDGSAILAKDRREPSATLRERRIALGLSVEHVARRAGVPKVTVERAETQTSRTSIRELGKIAMCLGLDERLLTFRPGAGGDNELAIRLKSWGLNAFRDPDVLTLSESAWVIETQHRLQKYLEPDFNLSDRFRPDSNYGQGPDYKAFQHGEHLAHVTRNALGYTDSDPIPPMRDICNRLRIPLVRAELSANIAGATVSTNTARGIVVNSSAGANNNVLVQRATVAHELGHLLWDPDEHLQSLVVDAYDDIEGPTPHEDSDDHRVEARANSFAVELLAPKAALRECLPSGPADVSIIGDLAAVLCERFGLSATAMKYHLWNAADRIYSRDAAIINFSPSESWKGSEGYGDDYFPIKTTSAMRTGGFAGVVVRAQRAGWLTPDTAAEYLNTDVDTYQGACADIIGMFPETA